jgi:hypothetical protein
MDRLRVQKFAERLAIVLLALAIVAVACCFGLYYALPKVTGGS